MDKMIEEKLPAGKPKRSTLIQIALGLITNFSSLAPSMSLGFSAIALPVLMSPENPNKLSSSQCSWFASIASIATPVGCFISGPISDRYGRRATILWVNSVCFFGWVLICVAYSIPKYQYEMLLLGRVVTGISTGLSSMPANVYMAEVSSTKLRGMFTTWNAISFSSGVLVVYVLGYLLKDNWGTIALVTAVFPCIGMFLALHFMPESPSWLVSKGQIGEARESMCKIFGAKEYRQDVREEIATLMQNQRARDTGSSSRVTLQDFLMPTCTKPFVLITMYFFFQQFSGVFVVVFYAVDIVKEVRVTVDPYLAIVLIAATRLVAAVIVSFLSKKYGRRPLSILSGSGMTLCMLLLAAYSVIPEEWVNEHSIGSLPVLLLMIYFFTSTLGFLTMPFAMAAEVFPARIRGVITGLITCLAYVFNFIVVKLYPEMIDKMGSDKLFLFYGAMCLSGTIFVILFLPETKGKSLQQIEEYFDRGKKGKELESFISEKV